MAKAKSTRNQDLIDHLHASGLRKRTAELIAETTDGRRKPARQVRAVVKEMKKALIDIEDRAKGGPAKRSAAAAAAKRSAAAKKGAATRKKNAAARSESAKKAAKTQTKSAA